MALIGQNSWRNQVTDWDKWWDRWDLKIKLSAPAVGGSSDWWELLQTSTSRSLLHTGSGLWPLGWVKDREPNALACETLSATTLAATRVKGCIMSVVVVFLLSSRHVPLSLPYRFQTPSPGCSSPSPALSPPWRSCFPAVSRSWCRRGTAGGCRRTWSTSCPPSPWLGPAQKRGCWGTTAAPAGRPSRRWRLSRPQWRPHWCLPATYCPTPSPRAGRPTHSWSMRTTGESSPPQPQKETFFISLHLNAR